MRDPQANSICTYVLIDNCKRAPSDSPFDFNVSLANASTPFQQVFAVRVVQMQVAKMVTEDYIIMSIDPLDRIVQCFGDGELDAFAVCMYMNMDYLQLNATSGDCITGETTFDPPLARLNNLRIRFKKYDGDMVTQGDFRNQDGSINPTFDKIMMVLAITHKNANVQ
jgi:hypothetical protein